MTSTKANRRERFLPGGVPKYIRVYDNGGIDAGGSFDRYTCVFTGKNADGMYVGMSEDPFHPQGFGQHGQSPGHGPRFTPIDVNDHGWAPAIGRKNHLGTRIKFEDLPEKCRKLVMTDYRDINRL